eukprot:gene13656-10521_t
MFGLFLVTFVPNVVGEFIALEPTDYKHHFLEGWPGPWQNGSGVDNINIRFTYTWAVDNLPLFDSSDADLVSAYYYRAKSYKSHLEPTEWEDITHVSSEFGPAVPWGGPYGTINAAAGHHLSEGRWIRNRGYMDGLARFWIGSQVGGGPGWTPGAPGAFEPGVGHYANGTKGQPGSTPYSSWILTGAIKAAAVKGDLTLGKDFKNNPVTYADMLPMMVQWWEQRSMQLRTDCIITNGGSTNGEDKACLDTPMVPGGIPVCYIMADGWDAMEGSVSGNGCRPTIGAMMISEAEAIATVANATGNATLAAVFTKRAEFSGMGGCTQATLRNQSDSLCCCVPEGENVGHYRNFSVCNPHPAPPSPGNAS